MNLTKLFNFKYLWQNIKKSKMAIILYILVVPIFTTIMLITAQNRIYTNTNTGFINIAGMYVIPFLFSVALFGYVYKKSSVDFIGSMPISRSTIFATNTLGGIILILITQVITLIMTIIVGAVTDAIVFPALILEMFLYQFVAYIYFFTTANLAMTLSGNIMTQMVVTLLVLFFLPVSNIYVQLITEEFIEHPFINNYFSYSYDFDTLAAPLKLANGNYIFNTISLLKMLALSVIYIVIGMVLFNKRKMEMATESFVKPFTHILVKSLTLLPFALVIAAVIIADDAYELMLIMLGIIVVYWFIYDLITNKKIKFWKNLLCLVLSLVVIVGIYVLIPNINATRINNYTLNDITKLEVYVEDINYENNIIKYYSIKNNDDIVNFINKAYNSDNSETVSEYPDNSDKESNTKSEVLKRIRTKLKIKTLLDEFEDYINIPEEVFNEIEEYEVIRKENTDEYRPSSFAKINLYREVGTNEEKKELLEYIRTLEPTSYRTYERYFYSVYPRTQREYISVYDYRNHQIILFNYNYEKNPELMKKVDKLYKTAAIKMMQTKDIEKYRGSVLRSIYDPINECYYNNYFYSKDIIVDLKKFISEDYNKEIDYDKQHLILEIGMGDYIILYKTNDIDGVRSFMEKYYSEDPEIFTDEYYFDAETGVPIPIETNTTENQDEYQDENEDESKNENQDENENINNEENNINSGENSDIVAYLKNANSGGNIIQNNENKLKYLGENVEFYDKIMYNCTVDIDNYQNTNFLPAIEAV